MKYKKGIQNGYMIFIIMKITREFFFSQNLKKISFHHISFFISPNLYILSKCIHFDLVSYESKNDFLETSRNKKYFLISKILKLQLYHSDLNDKIKPQDLK